MRNYLFFLSLIYIVMAGCSTQSGAQELTVFAAASLTEAFSEMAESFEAENPDVKVVLNFAGSQTLRTQLEEGAQADVFASANLKHMEAVIASGLVNAANSQIFLKNELVIVLPADNPFGAGGLDELASPGLKLVMAAPEVPVGAYALESLGNLNALYGDLFQQDVLANLVSREENVKQVITKVELGEVDAGMVYRSDAVAAPKLMVLAIPAEYNVIAEYPIASLNAAQQPELAAEFIHFVLSPEGQSILARWGFTPVSS